jgi:S-DNA-T family DNA segregation ATPase FtsK/SpoIIIE
MLTDRIIGRVGADILARILPIARPTPKGPIRPRCSGSTSSLRVRSRRSRARSWPTRPAARVDLMIPRLWSKGQGLPAEEALIQHNAGYVRNNARPTKEAILTANGNEHNLADTLGHVTALGAKELRADEEPWVDATCHVGGISPCPKTALVFRSALGGLIAATDLSLIQLGEFCAEDQRGHLHPGPPIRDAIGWSLPFVGLPATPRSSPAPRPMGLHSAPWRKAFEKLFDQRAPLLKKERPNGQPLDPEEMKRALGRKRRDPDAARLTLEAFINAPTGDEATANELALFEWEKDGVHYIFDKPREKPARPGRVDAPLL